MLFHIKSSFKRCLSIGAVFSLGFGVSTHATVSKGQEPTPTPAPQSIKVVATVPYLAHLAEEVSCSDSRFQIEAIVPPSADPHHFSLRPSDRRKLVGTNVVLEIGAGFDPWLKGVKRENGVTWVTVTSDMKLRSLDNQSSGHRHGHHHHGAHDPHIWHSPELSIQAAKAISEALKKKVPDLTSRLDECFTTFESKVQGEVVELKKKVAEIPEKERDIAVNHDAFGYFADSFGVRMHAISGIATESAPSPRQMREIVETIRSQNIKAIFPEKTTADRAVNSVAREAGIKVGGGLHADGLGEAGSGAETLTGLWRKNIETILQALK